MSATSLLNFGRAVLSATYALDEGSDIAQSSAPRVLLGRKALPGWAIRLLALALLLPPLLVSIDALARLRRRREPVLRWVVWTLTGALRVLHVRAVCNPARSAWDRRGACSSTASRGLSADGSVAGAVASVVLVLVLALLAWPGARAPPGAAVAPSADGAALAVMLVLLAVALLVWVFNPFACLLLAPALHLWLLAVGPSRQTRARLLALSAIFAGALPLVLLLLLYAHELGLEPGGLPASAVVALAGGR